VAAAGFERVLCAAWRGDNEGPHAPEEALAIFARLGQQFPGAAVVASSFDDFVGPLLGAAPRLALPVVTAEIGDTWIHGAASDPGKLSDFRALLRLRRASADRWDDAEFAAFSRLLLKIPEHTWGVDSKQYPGDYARWSNAELQRALAEGDAAFAAAVGSWERQRAYNEWAVQELGAPCMVAAAEEGRR
jgi:hypothetical protein